MNFTAQDVEQMIENQRDFYFTGKTKDVQFRKQQLMNLKKIMLLQLDGLVSAI